MILKRLQAAVRLHALRHPPVERGVRLALGKVGTEAKPSRPHESVVYGQADETIHRIPILVYAVGDVAHDARPIIDLAVGRDCALAVAVYVDMKELASAFLIQALGLLARVQNLAADAAMVALQDVVIHAWSFFCSVSLFG